MTDRILGFQVVLLDEQGVELRRIPDVYYDEPYIIVDDARFALSHVKMEGGQRVRYFKPMPEGQTEADVTQQVAAALAADETLLALTPRGIWTEH